MEDWSLQAVKILETPKEEGAPTDTKKAEKHVEVMPVVVMQKDVPPQRTCMKQKAGKQFTKGDIPVECGNKACITYNARDMEKQMIDPDFDINRISILAKFVEMKGDEQYRNCLLYTSDAADE
eukprot:13400158-Heterocapsa_arctica.AAC.1